MSKNRSSFLKSVQPFHGTFGTDVFGRRAEAFARLFGTPRFLIAQTVVVGIWIAINAIAVSLRWDPYPFILLNLAFSLQAAYAAPLILLAQTRQADRDKAMNEADSAHREELANEAIEREQQTYRTSQQLRELLELNTQLTRQIEQLTKEIHGKVVEATA